MQAYRGKKRSGKTYNVVKNIVIPAVIANRNIFTNIPLEVAIIKSDYPDYMGEIVLIERMTPEVVLRCPAGYIIIIDECYTVFPTGMKANAIRSKIMELLAHQYHYVDENGQCTDIILLYQTESLVYKPILDLCDEIIHHKKLSSLGFSSKFRWDVYDNKLMNKDTLLNSGVSYYESKYWKYYKTQTKSMFSGIGNEKSLDKRGVIWKRWQFTVLPVLLILLVYFFIYPKLHKFFNRDTIEKPIIKNDSGIKLHPDNIDVNINKLVTNSHTSISESKQTIPDSKIFRYAGDNINMHIAYIEHTPTKKLIKISLIYCQSIPDNSCIYHGEFISSYTGFKDKHEELLLDSASIPNLSNTTK